MVTESESGGPSSFWERLDELNRQCNLLIAALRPIAAAYSDDPGTSDLYDEQPVTITLGDVRKARAALKSCGTD